MKKLKPFINESDVSGEASEWIKTVRRKATMLSPFLIDFMDEMESKLTKDMAKEILKRVENENPENVHIAATNAAIVYILKQYLKS